MSRIYNMIGGENQLGLLDRYTVSKMTNKDDVYNLNRGKYKEASTMIEDVIYKKEYLKCKSKVNETLLYKMSVDEQFDDEEFMQLILDVVGEESDDDIKTADIARRIFQSIRQNDVIQDLLDDESITEIMINGYDSIFIERNGRLEKSNIQFESNLRLQDVIQRMVSSVNRMVNEASPIVDARLLDGSRINVVLPPIAVDGPIVTIRKFPKQPIDMSKLVEYGSITSEVVLFLRQLIKAKYNIFISGGTGSGKTTFLNALSDFIPRDERIITIEDSAELQIKNIPNIVRLEVRNANVEGKKAVTIRDLIKAALRMRPNRIIVGEVRDSAAIDLLDAYNTGHDGSLSTGHANSAYDMLGRLESMVLMGTDMPIGVIRKKIVSAIDVVIHIGRLRDSTRSVLEICEVVGIDDKDGYVLNKLFEFKEDAVKEGEESSNNIGRLVRTDSSLINVDKLQKAGIDI